MATVKSLFPFLPESTSLNTYLLPLFWSRNSVAGSTISNWIGVPGAISSSASGILTVAVGTILSFSISEFFRLWLENRREKSQIPFMPLQTNEYMPNADGDRESPITPSTLQTELRKTPFVPWLKAHHWPWALLHSILRGCTARYINWFCLSFSPWCKVLRAWSCVLLDTQ